jgi:hypothetical protein
MKSTTKSPLCAWLCQNGQIRTRALSAGLTLAAFAVLGLAGCSDRAITATPTKIQQQVSNTIAPVLTACPTGLPTGSSCFTGQAASGSQFLIAIPPIWNQTLAIFNRSATSIPLSVARALGPAFSLMGEGVAFAASDYQGVVLAVEAASRAEELRQIFVATFGKPRRTVVYGASLGGLATARCMELFGVNQDGSRNYDGALSGCGPLAGTLVANYTRLDLRVVYQYYCRNHPRLSEPQYPLYLGLAPGTTMTDADLQQRVDECTGLSLNPAARTPEQQRILTNILAVLRIPENEFLRNMAGATTGLRELVQVKLGGRNAFPNVDVQYRGADDDEALNKGVERYESDPTAVSELRAADTPTGQIAAPVATMHTIDDGRAFVEHEWAYRHTLGSAGVKELLFQTYTNDGPHCSFTPPEWMAALSALLEWIDTGTKPTAADVVAACERYAAQVGGTCAINSTFEPAPLVTRIYPRRP